MPGATSIAEEITVNKTLTNFFSQWFQCCRYDVKCGGNQSQQHFN